ncbi:MAG: tRNA (adenosine(37)-N6)-threonylcarbamoyltransferase complex dimerization subunit type 1 TsaB [Candidatus Symbiothrix sp.]|jgi:tRNA threonylcarbamoyladenosine biosynthesis protein TsaB|nr:tRNA (adenosine(37)-N6)-threonylcarbamoyltransferase complex dimerization subunit type 1 TsaB [Candidatus Symbiothrix sp.]
MACILAIETATRICSVHLSLNGKNIFNRIHTGEVSHASILGVFVAEAVKSARKNTLKIDAVAVSAGPGSYTGLRIGVSEAKGLCYGLDIPLIALPTLQILAAATILNSQFSILNSQLLCPLLDARRMEVYSALYDNELNEIRPAEAEIIDENSFKKYLEKQPVIFFGSGADKCRDLIQSPNAHFIDNIIPTAEAMIPLSDKAFADKAFVDVAYFEPYYLKEFQATVPKKQELFVPLRPHFKNRQF